MYLPVLEVTLGLAARWLKEMNFATTDELELAFDRSIESLNTELLKRIPMRSAQVRASVASMRAQMLASHQRANRLYTLFQLPYVVGSSRHCAPLWAIQKTPSIKRRHFSAVP